MSAWLTSAPVGAVVWVSLLVICVTGSMFIERNSASGLAARRLFWCGAVLGSGWLLLVAWRFIARA